MTTIPNLVLHNETEIPQLGFGTYKVTDNATEVIGTALKLGYRHLDGAQMYRNEPEVGEAWTASGVAREELFLTSKLDNPNHEPDKARESFAQTLRDLRTDYVDLFLIHWPLPMYYDGDFVTTWKVLEEFLEDGRARAIGVSNFEPNQLERIIENADVAPMVNQVESQPYFPNYAVHDFDSSHGIVTEAWSPLARGRVLDDPILTEIAKRHDATVSQVTLRWSLQRGDVIFPKASSEERQRENMDIFGFELTQADMDDIARLDEGQAGRTGKHPYVMDRM